jgi:RNA polymerase sigma factor (sigma-70 family)
MQPSLSDAQALRESVVEPSLFALLYERHLGVIARYITRRVGGEIAEDLVAEVFLRAFRGRARYRDEHTTALPWLLGIASNLIADHRKAEHRRLAALQQLASTTPVSSEPNVSALAPELVRELLRLPAVDRDALLLVIWGELTYAEAATALRVPIGTIRSRIARARQRLGHAVGHPATCEEQIVKGEAHA